MFAAPQVLNDLRTGAHLVLSISGGKDSDAMTIALLAQRQKENWPGEAVLVHSDLGRVEHKITPEYVREFHRRMNLRFGHSGNIPLIVERHSKRDLLEGIRHRMATRPGVPPWPSPKNRWCTSDYKRSVISRVIRNRYPKDAVVICAMGLRAEESPARAKRPALSTRKDCTATTKNRTVYDWLPVREWSLDQVWNVIGMNQGEMERDGAAARRAAKIMGITPAEALLRYGFPAHPAYALGNERLSCALCIMGSENDLLNGIEQDPELYVEFCRIEVESGFSFRQNLWLATLRPDLLPEDILLWHSMREMVG